MSKLMWLLGAGAGAMVLAGLGHGDEAPTGDGGKTPVGGGGEGGDTPEPLPSGGDVPKPGLDDAPDPPEPWAPLPYDAYERGPYTIDLTGLSTGVRWRVYATKAQPPTEAAKDAVKLGAGVELSDVEARVAANAFVDALGVLPVEPYPLPPKPMPDPPDGVTGAEGAAEPPGPGGASEPPKPEVPPYSGGIVPPLHSSGVGDDPTTLEVHGPVIQAHGLRVSNLCTRIAVDDMVSWVAWAEPVLRDRVMTTPRTTLVLELLEQSFPGCVWDLAHVRVQDDRLLLHTLAEVDAKHFAKARSRVVLPEPAWKPLPLEHAVAELVGGVAPPVAPPEFAYRGYHIEAEPLPSGWL